LTSNPCNTRSSFTIEQTCRTAKGIAGKSGKTVVNQFAIKR
jgi:hypothetical protein